MPRLLLFRIGSEQYGLEIEALQEVADDPRLYLLPLSAPYLLGAVNLHGRVLPVVDLPALLGTAPAPRDQRLLILNFEFYGLALAVSGVGRIASFEAADLRLPTAEEQGRAVAGVIEAGEPPEPINLLDPRLVVERLENLYAA